ncbi:hypothetical protein [Mucilaginibacter terrenus]|uniref:hypothetical protein n=1 Tax=Mucilaginibacter terrenus TaxID=2482727 RepID=UPI0010589D30|nr:hypothetical protein [Mucilaginibacter terrenus]
MARRLPFAGKQKDRASGHLFERLNLIRPESASKNAILITRLSDALKRLYAATVHSLYQQRLQKTLRIRPTLR